MIWIHTVDEDHRILSFARNIQRNNYCNQFYFALVQLEANIIRIAIIEYDRSYPKNISNSHVHNWYSRIYSNKVKYTKLVWMETMFVIESGCDF